MVNPSDSTEFLGTGELSPRDAGTRQQEGCLRALLASTEVEAEHKVPEATAWWGTSGRVEVFWGKGMEKFMKTMTFLWA